MSLSGTSQLLQFAGHYIHFRCARCSILKKYDVDRTLASAGNYNIAGMCIVLAEHLKCLRVYTLSNWDVCGMEADLGPRIPRPGVAQDAVVAMRRLDRSSLHPITKIRLKNVPRWYDLYGSCPCGHVGYIDREKIARRFDDRADVQAMAAYLRCRVCTNKKGNLIMAMALPR